MEETTTDRKVVPIMLQQLTCESFSGQDENSSREHARGPPPRNQRFPLKVLPYKSVQLEDIDDSAQVALAPNQRHSSQVSNKSDAQEFDNPRSAFNSAVSPKEPAKLESSREASGPKLIGQDYPTVAKKSPSNKLPIKVFASQDFGSQNVIIKTVAGSKQGPAGRSAKFLFNGGLTIDVDEANKSFNNSEPPIAARKPSPVMNASRHSDSQSIEMVKHFYQEQIDRMNQRNEQLLRENERLRLDLIVAKNDAAENPKLKREIIELHLKQEVLIGKLRQAEKSGSKNINPRIDTLDFRQGEQHARGFGRTGEARLERSRSSRKSLGDKQETMKRQASAELIEEYITHPRKFVSENVSIDARDPSDKDSSYLRDFITKLKHANEVKVNFSSTKQGSGHKKTISLAASQTTQGKRKDLAGYYVSQNKGKPITVTSKPIVMTSAKGGPGAQNRLESKLGVQLRNCSREETSEAQPSDAKHSKRSSMANSITQDGFRASLGGENLNAELPDQAQDRKRIHQVDKKSTLQGLLMKGKSVNDYQKINLGIKNTLAIDQKLRGQGQ